MPPSRFTNVSKWRNVIGQPAKPEGQFSELGLASASDSGSVIKASTDFIVAKGRISGSLVVLSHHAFAKYAKNPPSFQAAPSSISDFDLSPFEEDLVAAGTDSGLVAIHRLTSFSPDSDSSLSSPIVTLSASGSVSNVIFHPTSSGLLASAQSSELRIWDFANHHAQSGPSILLDAVSPVVSSAWSLDGSLLSAASKDATIRMYDARASSHSIGSVQAHASKVKPCRVAFVGSSLFTTGFSMTREREWAVWDPRSLASPIKRASVDTSTAILHPLVDQDRGLVYLAGKGDSSLKWVEVDGAKMFTDSSFALPFSMGGVAIAPSTVHRVMEGEIDRLYLTTSASEDSIVPLSVIVPRRQYIDFHADLYPLTSSRVPAQTSSSWLSGEDASVELISQDPSVSAAERAAARQQNSSIVEQLDTRSDPALLEEKAVESNVKPSESVPSASSETPSLADHVSTQLGDMSVAGRDSINGSLHKMNELETPSTIQGGVPLAEEAIRKETTAPAAKAHSSERTPQVLSVKKLATTQPIASKSKWSRRFLAGSTPLIAAHPNLVGLDLGMPPDGRMLAANRSYLFFPLAGPGSKIAFHSTSQTGRLPAQLSSLVSTSKLVDFAINPFDDHCLVSIHDDSCLRVWRLPASTRLEHPITINEPEATPECKKAGKMAEVAFHPTAKGLVATCCPEANGCVLLWDLGTTCEPSYIHIQGEGVQSLSWSHDGSRLALACKDRTIRVLDFGKAHCKATSSTEQSAVNLLQQNLVFSENPSDRPHVTLTFAQSQDGKIAGPGKKQLALSGKESMLMMHVLRAAHDGIMVGIGTVLNDDPQLNARLLSHPPVVDKLPQPVILDTSLRTPTGCKLIQNYINGVGRKPWIICSEGVDTARKEALEKSGAEIIEAPEVEGKLEWKTLLTKLAHRGIRRLMVEGGAFVIDSLLSERQLIDSLLVTVASRTVGTDGLGFSTPLPHPLSEEGRAYWAQDLNLAAQETFGADQVLIWNKGGPTQPAKPVENNLTVEPVVLPLSDLRNFRTTWLDREFMVVVGHAAGSARQVRLLRLKSNESFESVSLEEKARLTLDMSPAILFPHWDPDTNILWLWSKGERSVSAYELYPHDQNVFSPIPAFQHQQPQLGVAFLSKEDADPRKVEIAVSYRIEKGEIRRISWTIPRLRAEFFQDDIFVPTRDTSVSLTTASKWLAGKPDDTDPTYLDLCPNGMKPLSQAPEVKKQSKLPKGPIQRGLTEEERKEQLLDGIFRKAKQEPSQIKSRDADSDEEYQMGAATKRAPDTDDWSD